MAGIRLLSQHSLGTFAGTMQTHRDGLQEAACGPAARYDTVKSEAHRRLGTLDALIDPDVSLPIIEPPNQLMALQPE